MLIRMPKLMLSGYGYFWNVCFDSLHGAKQVISIWYILEQPHSGWNIPQSTMITESESQTHQHFQNPLATFCENVTCLKHPPSQVQQRGLVVQIAWCSGGSMRFPLWITIGRYWLFLECDTARLEKWRMFSLVAMAGKALGDWQTIQLTLTDWDLLQIKSS